MTPDDLAAIEARHPDHYHDCTYAVPMQRGDPCDARCLLSQVERLREALTWTEKFYSTALSENGCPCRHALGIRCPMHAALEADDD
jgi:hypothetical protein